jgi:hypothetical protein
MTFTKPVRLTDIADYETEIRKFFPDVVWKFGQYSTTGSYFARYSTEKYWEFEIVVELKYRSSKIERWLAMGGVYGAEGRTLAEMLSNLKMVLAWHPSSYKTATLNWLIQFPKFAELTADPFPQEWKPSEEDYELVRQALKKEYSWVKGYGATKEEYPIYFDHNHKIQFDLGKIYERPARLNIPVIATNGKKFTLVVYTDGKPPMITGRS